MSARTPSSEPSAHLLPQGEKEEGFAVLAEKEGESAAFAEKEESVPKNHFPFPSPLSEEGAHGGQPDKAFPSPLAGEGARRAGEEGQQ